MLLLLVSAVHLDSKRFQVPYNHFFAHNKNDNGEHSCHDDDDDNAISLLGVIASCQSSVGRIVSCAVA